MASINQMTKAQQAQLITSASSNLFFSNLTSNPGLCVTSLNPTSSYSNGWYSAWTNNSTGTATQTSPYYITTQQNITVAAPPEFNKFVNCSDLLEEFIEFLGKQGVKQGEVKEIPIELFMKWLVIKACEEDDEDPGIEMPLIPKTTQPRCMHCGQFMSYGVKVPLHEDCSVYYFKNRKR